MPSLDTLTAFEVGRDPYSPLVDSFQLILDRAAAPAVLRLQYAPAGTLAYADCLTVTPTGILTATIGLATPLITSTTITAATVIADVGVFTRVGIGTPAPAVPLHVVALSEQVRIAYDLSNYLTVVTNSVGLVSFTAVGTASGINLNTGSVGGVIVQSDNATGVSTLSNFVVNATSLTTGTAVFLNGFPTSGKLVEIQVSGSGGLTNQTALNVLTSGANANATQTTYGAQISNTHDGLTSTNIGLSLSASGGTTANYALIIPSGNVGIGTTAPPNLLSLVWSSANTSPWAIPGPMELRNSSNTANNWSGIQFDDAGGTIACGIAAQITDQTNHYGTLILSSRSAVGGFVEALRCTGAITTHNGPVTLKGYTVATLPAGVQGHLVFCTDLLAPGFLVAAVGGGAVVGPVFYNGAAWVAV